MYILYTTFMYTLLQKNTRRINNRRPDKMRVPLSAGGEGLSGENETHVIAGFE